MNREMKNDLVNIVSDLYNKKKWKEILKLNEKSDNKNALKIMWIWPSEEDLNFLRDIFKEYSILGVTSIGCGCGLLEWIIQEYTGLPVIGLEVNRAWWECKYSIPTFIPLRYADEGEDDIAECNDKFALLFCYFNNGAAFKEYVQYYRGLMIIIIGPVHGSGRHTDPEPFSPDFGYTKWQLVQYQEINKNTKDFIAVYLRQGTEKVI